MEKRNPLVGVAIFVCRDGKILLSLRKNSHSAGTWGLAGGHLEFGETFEECALRELKEEAGAIAVANVRFATISGDVFPDVDRHYVTIFMTGDYVSGEAENMEPHKFERWEWFKPSELPPNLFPSLKTIIDRGFDPFAI
ncbi:MAG: NUDIX domain-containing protein [Candidatus Peribacteraceae bacterium]|nr:NUDIX domain-containing protein [Candidatus Peribacteraceae bacterium]